MKKKINYSNELSLAYYELDNFYYIEFYKYYINKNIKGLVEKVTYKISISKFNKYILPAIDNDTGLIIKFFNENLKYRYIHIYYFNNGNKKYEYHYSGDALHRIDKPAIINFYKNGKVLQNIYMTDNMIHNSNGPARIEYSKKGKVLSKSYWLNNVNINVNSDEALKKYIKLLIIS